MHKETFTFPVAALPRQGVRKCYHWYNDKIGKVWVMVGYCANTLPYHLAMLNEIRQALPNVDLKKVTFGKIYTSRIYNRYTIVAAEIQGPKFEIPGFEEFGQIEFDYE